MNYTLPDLSTIISAFQTGSPIPITDENGLEAALTIRLFCAPDGNSNRLIGGIIAGRSVAGTLKVQSTGRLLPSSISLASRPLVLTSSDLAAIRKETAVPTAATA